MASNLDKYKEHIKRLLPTGFAWDQVRLHPLWEGIAGEFCRIGDRAKDLLREIDPNQTSELLEDWKATVGIPDECTPDDITLQETRDQIVQKLATEGSLSAKFFEDLALFYGFEITVTNWVPFQVGKSRVGDRLSNTTPPRDIFRVENNRVGDQLRTFGWVHYFNAELPLTANDPFRVETNRVEDRLVVYGNELLQCTIKKLKPAHSGVTFTFKA